MFKAVIFSCLHYTESPPIMRKDGYGDRVLQKLDFILTEAASRGADIYCLGDMFHRKAITSIREVNKIVRMLSLRKDVHFNMILGNHDIQGYNQDLSTQPVGVLQGAELIDLEVGYENGGRCKGNVFVTGRHFHAGYDVPETFDAKLPNGVEDCFHIHLTHGTLVNKRVPFPAVQVGELNLSCDLLFNGHYHAYWEDKELGVYNVGSVARVAMSENEINKKPVCLYLEVDDNTKKYKIEKIQIPCEKDVWINEVKRESITEEQAGEFADSVKELEGMDSDKEMLDKILEKESDTVKKQTHKYLGD